MHQEHGIKNMASRTWHQEHGIKNMASRTWHQEHGIKNMASRTWVIDRVSTRAPLRTESKAAIAVLEQAVALLSVASRPSTGVLAERDCTG
jgi:hypothetical protein